LAKQQVNLFLTPDQRCERRPVQRLEPALDAALADHLVGVHRLRKALHLDSAEIATLEEIAEQPPRLWPDHDRAGFGKSLQAGSEVWRFAYHPALLSFAGGDQVADDDLPGANADADLQRLGSWELPDTVNQSQAGAYGLLGVVLVRLRITEVHQHAIAHVLGDKAIETGDRIGDAAMIGTNDLAQVLGIPVRCKRRRADQIAEQHGKLPAFGNAFGLRVGQSRLRCCWNGTGKLRDRGQHLPPMS
jgi:hypothetical protein